MTEIEAIEHYRKLKKINQIVVANAMGMTDKTYRTKLQNGGKDIEVYRYQAACKVLGIDPNDFLFNMVDESKITPFNIYQIPLLIHNASAGNGTHIADVEDNIECMMDVSKDMFKMSLSPAQQKAFVAVRVRGDSMMPTLKEDDVVVINTEDIMPKDGIFVIRINDCLFVKRLRCSISKVEILSDNPFYKTQVASGEWFEYNDIKIIGKVVVAICKW